MPVETIRVAFPGMVRRLLDIPSPESVSPAEEVQAAVGSKYHQLIRRKGVLVGADGRWIKPSRISPLPHTLHCPALRGLIKGEYGDLTAELRSTPFYDPSKLYLILLFRDSDHQFCLKQETTFTIHETHFSRSDLKLDSSINQRAKPEDIRDLLTFAGYLASICTRFARVPINHRFGKDDQLQNG